MRLRQVRKIGALLVALILMVNTVTTSQYKIVAVNENKSIDLVVGADKTSANVGETITYTISYSYSSTDGAFKNEEITVALADSLKATEITSSSHVYSDPSVNDKPIVFVMGTAVDADSNITLEAGSTGVVKIKAQVLPGGLINDGDVAISVIGGNGDPSDTGTVPVANEELPVVAVTVDDDWDWSFSKAKSNPSGNPTTDAAITYRMTVRGDDDFDIEDVVVTDELPEGAEYINASGGSVEGSYDEESNIVTWNVGDLDANAAKNIYLKVTYPNAYEAGETVTNTADVTASRVGVDSDESLSASANVTFEAPTPGMKNISKGNNHSGNGNDYGLDQTIRYTISSTGNSGNVPLDELSVIDVLPEEVDIDTITTSTKSGVAADFYYTTSPVVTTGAALNVTTDAAFEIDLAYELPDDEWTYMGSSDDASTYNLPSGVKPTALKWLYEDLPVDHTINGIYLYGRFDDDVEVGDLSIKNTVYSNAIAQDYDFDTYSSDDTKAATSYIDAVASQPYLQISKSANDSDFNDGETITYRILIKNYAQATGDLVLDADNTLKLMDTMDTDGGDPVFKNFVDITNKASYDVDFSLSDDEATLGDGVTQATWTINSLTLAPGEYIYIDYTVDVIEQTYVGNYGNAVVATPYTNGVENKTSYDTSSDYSGSVSIAVNFQGSLSSVKGTGYNIKDGASSYLQTDEDNNLAIVEDADGNVLDTSLNDYTIDGSFAMPTDQAIVNATIEGGKVRYRLEVSNEASNGDIFNIVLIDKLPAINDTGTIVSGERGSGWQPYLVNAITGEDGEPITDSDNVYIYYTTEAMTYAEIKSELSDTSSLNLGADHGKWTVEAPENITEVSHIKFEVDKTISPGAASSSVIFEWDMRAPVNADSTDGIAWNSFAFGARYSDEDNLPQSFLPSEPIKVGVRIEDDDILPASYNGKIGDRVWLDNNHNGLQDVDEVGINDILVNIYESDASGNVVGDPYDTTRTANIADELTGKPDPDQAGYYVFPNLSTTGNYVVEFVLNDVEVGVRQYLATSYDVDGATADTEDSNTLLQIDSKTYRSDVVVPGDENMTVDAGFYKKALVGDFVWFDENGDGSQGASEEGINDVVVKLYNTSDVLVDTVTTGDDSEGWADGYYEFLVDPGDYYIVFDYLTAETAAGDDYIVSPQESDADSGLGSNGIRTSQEANALRAQNTAQTPDFTLVSDQVNMTIDLGLFQYGRFGNLVWLDSNRDGKQDSGEAGVSALNVYLLNNSGANITDSANMTLLDKDGLTYAYTDGDGKVYAITDINGSYTFENRIPGTYQVKIMMPDDYSASPKNQASDDTVDSDGTPDDAYQDTYAVISSIIVTSGTDDMTYDQGIYPSFSLGNYVWFDKNGDGVQNSDADEIGLNGVELKLNGSSNHIATTAGGGAYQFDDLSMGTYYIEVNYGGYSPGYSLSLQDGGDPNDDTTDSDVNVNNNASGRYVFDGDSTEGEHYPHLDAGLIKLGTIGDTVWHDKDYSGLQDDVSAGISGIDVYLLDNAGTRLTDASGSAIKDTTNSSGAYEFTDLFPGAYQLEFDLTTNQTATWQLTSQGDGSLSETDSNAEVDANKTLIKNITVISGTVNPDGTELTAATDNQTLDVGLFQYATIGDLVWHDLNADGVQDSVELSNSDTTIVEGLTVNLYYNHPDTGWGLDATTTTISKGAYSFVDLYPGEYYLEFAAPSDYFFSSKNNGSSSKDSDVDVSTGKTETITLLSATDNLTWDAGVWTYASIGDYVWLDVLNLDGSQDATESAYTSGVLVELLDGNGDAITDGSDHAVTTTTGADGKYLFSDLVPGDYALRFNIPDDYSASPKGSGSNSDSDGLVNNVYMDATTITDTTTLISAEDDMSWDQGLYPSYELGDKVWNDVNGDGIQGSGEAGIAGISVTLYDNSDNYVDSLETDASGNYLFTDLSKGTYYVKVAMNANGYVESSTMDNSNLYILTDQVQGDNRGLDSDADRASGKTASVTFSAASAKQNLSLDIGLAIPAELGDYVWVDTDYDGLQDDGNTGYNGLAVSLLDDQGNAVLDKNGQALATNTATISNGAQGYYDFTDLLPGSYTVKIAMPDNYYITLNDSDTLASSLGSDSDGELSEDEAYALIKEVAIAQGDSNKSLDLGIYEKASLGDWVWTDVDFDGLQDSGEYGVGGISVSLYHGDGTSTGRTTTTSTEQASLGEYEFEGLDPGDYYVIFGNLRDDAAYIVTSANQGSNDGKDSDTKDNASGKLSSVQSTTVTLSSGEEDMALDLGLFAYAEVGNQVWLDDNRDGSFDDSEDGLDGVTVTLYYADTDTIVEVDGDQQITTTATTSVDGESIKGYYNFDNLMHYANGYYITFDVPTGYAVSPKTGAASLENNSDGQEDQVNFATLATTEDFTLYPTEMPMYYDQGLYEAFSIGDYLWMDFEGDGIQDNHINDLGLNDISINLYSNPDGSDRSDLDPLLTTTTATNPDDLNAKGYYLFENLPSGTYYLEISGLGGGQSITDQNVGDDDKDSDFDKDTYQTEDIVLGGSTTAHNPTIDGGLVILSGLGDTIWDDLNYDGIQDANEPGIENVKVQLRDSDGLIVSVTIDHDDGSSTTTNEIYTDETGEYFFPNIEPDNYTVEVTIPSGYLLTQANEGADEEADSDAVKDLDDTSIVVIENALLYSVDENNISYDVGFYKPASIGDVVWLDGNHNGVQDDFDDQDDLIVIPGITVNLYSADDLITILDTDTTGADGSYLFEGLTPGDYFVEFTGLLTDENANYIVTSQDVGNSDADDEIDSDGAINGDAGMQDTSKTATVTLISGQYNDTLDLGLFAWASIGDRVWNDINRDGIQDADELGIADVSVSLISGGTTLATTETDALGNYTFEELMQGTYQVVFDLTGLPKDYSVSAANKGADDEKDSDGLTDASQPYTYTQATISDIIIKPTDNYLKYDLGLYESFSLGDLVWEDLDADGIQDSNEAGINGVTVELYVEGNTQAIATRTTADKDGHAGHYHFEDLPMGRYYVMVDTTGYQVSPQNIADDSSDSDINQDEGVTGVYEFTFTSQDNYNPTADAGLYQLASLGNYVWLDENYNGLQDSNEEGIEGVSVWLYDGADLVSSDVSLNPVVTDSDGAYNFTGLEPGNYKLVFEIPDTYYLTETGDGSQAKLDSDPTTADGLTASIESLVLIANQEDMSRDMGLYQKGSIGDYVWLDADYDGGQDNVEAGIQGITVTLHKASDDLQVGDPKTTAADGSYLFDNLDPDVYYVKFAGLRDDQDYIVTTKDVGNDSTDSDASAGVLASTTTSDIVLTSGTSIEDVDLGLFAYASLGDFVWLDSNRNGVQDLGEIGIEGVTVKLLESGEEIESVITDANGYYSFEELMQGTYQVKILVPEGYSVSPYHVGGESTDSDGMVDDESMDTEAITTAIELKPTNEPLTYDFGLYESFSIGNYVWVDTNGNGLQDSGEEGLNDVVLELYTSTTSTTPINTSTSYTYNGQAGYYFFDELAMGTYYVKLRLPSGYNLTDANVGGDDLDSDIDPASLFSGGYTFNAETTVTYNSSVDVGLYRYASLGNYVWEDLDYDGYQDSDESGIAGVEVTLIDANGQIIQQEGLDYVTTDADGYYYFADVEPATYSLEFKLPDGYVVTKANASSDDDKDSDPEQDSLDKTKAVLENVILLDDESDYSLDLGLYQTASIGNYVWYEDDLDGIQGEDELGASGIKVTLSFGETELVTTTDVNGYYEFSDLVPGVYDINFEFQREYRYTTMDATVNGINDDSLDSDPDYFGDVEGIVLRSGDTVDDIDAGLKVYVEEDDDKRNDEDEEDLEEKDLPALEEEVETPEEGPFLDEEEIVIVRESAVEGDTSRSIIYRSTKDVKEIIVSVEPEEGSVEIIDSMIVYSPGIDFDGTDAVTLIIVSQDDQEDEFVLDIFGEVPEGSPELPRTGGIPTDILIGFGTLLLGAGLGLKYRTR